MVAQFAVGIFGVAITLAIGQGAGKAAFGIVGTADKGPELAGLEAQLTHAAGRTGARIGPIFLLREDVRAEGNIEGIEHVGDAQVPDLAHSGVEIFPEVAKELFPFQLTG